jgi:hypothetical protein
LEGKRRRNRERERERETERERELWRRRLQRRPDFKEASCSGNQTHFKKTKKKEEDEEEEEEEEEEERRRRSWQHVTLLANSFSSVLN